MKVNVRIEYKSGKIEICEIAINQISIVLEMLAKEQRLVSFKLI
jgi:hypothetical protein